MQQELNLFPAIENGVLKIHRCEKDIKGVLDILESMRKKSITENIGEFINNPGEKQNELDAI